MPFTFAAPVGSAVSALIAGKLKVPPIYLVICASVLQIIGFALLSTSSYSPRVAAAQYGYEVIAGFGCGINISILVLLTPFSVEKRDQGTSILFTGTHLNLPIRSLTCSYHISCCARIISSIPGHGRRNWPCYCNNRPERLRQVQTFPVTFERPGRSTATIGRGCSTFLTRDSSSHQERLCEWL